MQRYLTAWKLVKDTGVWQLASLVNLRAYDHLGEHNRLQWIYVRTSSLYLSACAGRLATLNSQM